MPAANDGVEGCEATALRDAAKTLFDRTATWTRFAEKMWDLVPRNGVTAVRPSRGGLPSQHSSFGSFELDEDQTLVVTTHPSDAPYQGFHLGSRWFVSLDYANRTSSLSAEQAYVSSDGLLRFVISLRDPGVPELAGSGGPHARVDDAALAGARGRARASADRRTRSVRGAS